MSVTLPVSAESKALPRGWLVVALLCLVGCLNYLDRIMITTMRSSIIDAIPMTDAQFGLLTSVFLWVYGLLSPFAGFLSDRFSRSLVITVSLFVWSAVTWLTAHATTFNELLATRALMGVSEACYLPAALALITDYHRGHTRSLATGLHMGGIMVGQSLGFLGGWIAEKYQWSHAFSIFGVVGITYALVLVFLLRDTPERSSRALQGAGSPEKVSFMEGMRDLFKRRNFLLLLAFWSVLGIVGWMILGWLPTYYQEHFHLSQSTAGLYATGYMHPISLAGGIAGGFITDAWSRKNGTARILLPALALVIAMPGVFIAGSTDVVMIAIGGFMLYAFMRIFSDVNLMPILCMIADDRYRATGYGVLNMLACIVGGAGIYASGLLRDAHFQMDVLFKTAALLLLVCAVLLLMIWSNVSRKS